MAADFEIFWDPNCNAEPDLEGYFIYYQKDASVLDDPGGAIDVYVALTDINFDSSNPSYVISDLQNDVRYCFAVTAWYGDEESDMSNEICGINGDYDMEPAPAPDPQPNPAPDPVPDPTPDPVPDPVPDPTPDPTPEPAPDPAPDPDSLPIPKSGWRLVYVDSEETVFEDGAAINAFDGDSHTMWHTKWRSSPITEHPHEIIIDLGKMYDLDRFSYEPYQLNGRIIDYAFFVGTGSGGPWTEVASGAFANDASVKSVSFSVTTGRYIRLVAYSEPSGNPWTSAAEIGVTGRLSSSANTAPNGVINSPAGNSKIYVGESVTFSGTGSDPDGDSSLSYRWQFGVGSGVADYTIDEDPGEIFFDHAGTFSVTFTVTDSEGTADPTPDTRVITVVEEPVPAPDPDSLPIPKSGWRLVYVDSEETVFEDGAAINAFDGDSHTMWHTKWRSSPITEHPHEIVIDLGKMYDLDGFSYEPYQLNGRIIDYAFFVGPGSGGPWTEVTSGAFANDMSVKSVAFSVTAGRYVRLVAYSEPRGNPWTSAAEIGVTGRLLSPTNTAPNGVIDSPAINQTIQVGESIDFSGTGSDPDGDSSLSYRWQFGSGSGIADYTIDDDPGEIFFDNAGTYTVTLTVTDSDGAADPTPDTRVITVVEQSSSGTIAKSGWKLVYADSEETFAEDGAATNAFDGDSGTMWHTQWYGSPDPEHPHEIIIDLGATYDLDGFSYEPYQLNGRIIDYAFFVGTGSSGPWTKVASGAFANNASVKSVPFSATIGRYIRLVAYSEPRGNPWASAAEIGVTGIRR